MTSFERIFMKINSNLESNYLIKNDDFSFENYHDLNICLKNKFFEIMKGVENGKNKHGTI